jgi:hypothetical protein
VLFFEAMVISPVSGMDNGAKPLPPGYGTPGLFDVGIEREVRGGFGRRG